MFDKTGTLTQGAYGLEAVVGEGLDEVELLIRLASVERDSPHFLAREIVRRGANKRGKGPSRPRILRPLRALG